MKSTGVVSRWELNYVGKDDELVVVNMRSWEEATDAFREAIKNGAVGAVVYAVSGRGDSRKIPTWVS